MNVQNLKETIKTIALSMLIAGVSAFMAGVHYQSGIDNTLAHAVKTVTVQVQAPSK